jgi:serine protease Do
LQVGIAAFSLALAPTPVRAHELPSPIDLARQLNQAFGDVAEQVTPSVVVLRVARKPEATAAEDRRDLFWEFLPREFRKRSREKPDGEGDARSSSSSPSSATREPVFDGEGSGVVLREDGFLLTNLHVVDGAERIKVRLHDGREFEAEVRGVDRRSDLAVLKIDATRLRPARFGDSGKARVGEFVLAIGAPFDLDYSVTVGHISARGRTRILDDPKADQDFLQTDASINPGNSGGPLINLAGEVIGINTLIRGMHTGIGFAIPSHLARDVAERLMEDGRFVRAWLGVGVRALAEAPDFRALLPEVTQGLVVTEIKQSGPAARSDLKPADVIVGVDGAPVAAPQDFKRAIRSKRPGQDLLLDVRRGGKTVQVRVATAAWPEETLAVSRMTPPPPERVERFGLAVETLTPETGAELGLEKLNGVLVSKVEENGPADRAGIEPGNVILEVNRRPVTTPRQFEEALKGAGTAGRLLLMFATRDSVKCEILKGTGD